MSHTHTFDTAVDFVPGFLFVPDIIACQCGAFAVIGEGSTKAITEPEEMKCEHD
jgi:hypothetical protein